METVDLDFALLGTTIPMDHGYALFSAVSALVPAAHRHREIGLHRISGQAGGDRLLHLTDRSRLRIRLPAGLIPEFLVLSGRTLAVDGHTLRVGVPQVRALTPAAALAARMVTVKGFLDPAGFTAAARRQLDSLGISPEAQLGIPPAGGAHAGQPLRRILRVKDKTVVGYAVRVVALTAEESLTLQARGLGGRRHMGCGIFLPIRGSGVDV